MLYELSTAINEDLVEINSKFILHELRTYPKEDLQIVRVKDEESTHWDRVMACAIGWKIRTSSMREDGALLTDDTPQTSAKPGVVVKDGMVREDEMMVEKEDDEDSWRYS